MAASSAGTRPAPSRPRGRYDYDPDDQAAASRELKRQAAAHDRRLHAHYQAGLTGAPLDDDADDDEAAAHASGVDEANRRATDAAGSVAAGYPTSPSAAGGSSHSGGGRPLAIRAASEGVSVGVGLVGYAVVLAYLDYGWPGVKGWLSAKFANKVTLNVPSKNQGAPVVPLKKIGPELLNGTLPAGAVTTPTINTTWGG